MSKLLPAMAIGLSVVTFPLAAMILPAMGEQPVATVTIGGAFADELSTATGIDVAEIPTSLTVPLNVAARVCVGSIVPGGTCEGTDRADVLVSYLSESSDSSSEEESSSSEPESSSEEPGASAKSLAPGQVKADGESAKAYAPGQIKGDGESASDQAPGQQKGDNGKK
jgi:hypothetical protein